MKYRHKRILSGVQSEGLRQISQGRRPWYRDPPEKSPVRAKQLTPHIALVIVNVAAIEEASKFFVERHCAMMFVLCRDVLRNGGFVGFAHGKRPVSALPVETLETWGLRLHPFRGSLLDLLNCPSRRRIPAQVRQDMDVVARTAYLDRQAIKLG